MQFPLNYIIKNRRNLIDIGKIYAYVLKDTIQILD